jgi:serine/threonine protein kinase
MAHGSGAIGTSLQLQDAMESRPNMPLPAGTRLGPYEILDSIGAGGMGHVYRARDTRFHRDVAVKVSDEQFS